MSTKPVPGVWPAGFGRIDLPEVDSTMAEAVRRLASLDQPTWISAAHQTAARGRRGKAWIVPPGNLSATLMIPAARISAIAAAQHSFVAANALFAALSVYVDPALLGLKWPNDVLVETDNGVGKVAGILLESSGTGGTVDWLAIGIGMNLAHVPTGVTDAVFAPTSLAAAGAGVVDPQDFLTTLASCYAAQEAVLAQNGFAAVRAEWLRHAIRLGQEITARTPQEDISGTFDTIDEDGHLVLVTKAGRRVISAADVFF